MSIMVATGKGATMGVLFRNAEAIETMRKINTLVVDKTGTLTLGKPKLTGVVPCGRHERGKTPTAASLEKASEHPLAAAIVEGAGRAGGHDPDVVDFDSHTGKGVSGTVEGVRVLLGNLKLMEDADVATCGTG
jgi:P-type Cu+ transporter